jgi:hypothetical protein
LQQSIAFFKTGDAGESPRADRALALERRATAPRLTARVSAAPVRSAGSSNFRPY